MTSSTLRQIRHPGPPAPERIEAVSARLRRIEAELAPGLAVLDAVAAIFAEAGCDGGAIELTGGTCELFRYLIPALATDASHAAWYSDNIAPAGPVVIERATAIVGRRDGKPFLHCHGIWRTADGARRMGHLLPLDCVVRESIAASGVGAAGAFFDALPDPETNFTLFSPVGDPHEDSDGLFVRVRPNEDILAAIERVAAAHGIAAARISGIGSLNEVAFEDGRHVPSLATELMITDGRLAPGDDGPLATLEIAVVDIHGTIHEGRLARGDNPVCVTFELVIQAVG